MLLGAILSLILGMGNLVIWLGIVIPQVYKNYKRGSSDAVSYLLYLKWMIGGVISLFSAILKGVNITVLYVGIHHQVMNVILIAQLIYYRIRNKTYITEFESILTLVLIGCITILFIAILSLSDGIQKILIEILAWCAAMLFSTSRLHQIYLNWERKSVDGLAKWSFFSMIFTDVFFITSILVNAIDGEKTILELIYLNIQWISTCCITLTCTFIIIYQFHIYKNGYVQINTENFEV